MAKSHAILLILAGAVGMSLAALCVRLIDQADGYQILTYRSLTLAAMVALMACLRRGTGLWGLLRALDRTDWSMGWVLSLAFTTYVFALLNTSVASALFILAAAPLIAAILGWLALGEKPRPMVWLTIVLAATGIGIMAGEGIGLGRSWGNLLAFCSAALFATMLVIARRSGKADVLGGTFLGGVLSCLLAAAAALTIGNGLGVSGYDLTVSLVMGAFTIGIGIGLVTWGTPYVPAAEVSLLVLLESVLSPLWVWGFLGESMSLREIMGGSIVLIAVAALTLTNVTPKRTVARGRAER